MILRSIELENFGKFRGQIFELRRGMNLVLGPNEAGKSTLVEAIPVALFGTRQAERFKPWGRNACAVKLVFEGRNRTVEVRRDLLTDEVHLVERDDMYHTLAEFRGKVAVRGRSAAYQEYRELLSRLLGIGDEDLFRATCFFGHRPQEWTGDELSQKLRTLIGGGSNEGDYAEIMDRLLADHFALTRVNPWGRDKQRDRELEDLERETAALEQSLPPQEEEDGAHDLQAGAKIAALAAEIEKDRTEYEKGVRYVEQVRQRVGQAKPAAVTDVESVKEAEEVSPKSQAMGSDLKSRLAAAGLPDNLPAELPEILQQASDIRQEFARLQQPFSRLNQEEGRIKKAPWVSIALLVLVLGIVGGLAWWQHFLVPWAPVGAGVVALGGLGFAGLRQVQCGKAQADCKQKRTRLELQRAQAQERQDNLSERCETLGLPSSAVDMVRLQKLVTKHRDLLDELWGAAPAQKADAPPIPTTEETAPESEEQRELAELEERLAAFAMDLQRKEQELEALQRPAAVAAPGQSSSPELEALKQRKVQLERRIAVLREAVELLAGAVDKYTRSDLTRLVDEVSRLFSKVTKGRYRQVRLDTDMHPEVMIGERRWQPIERFSRGTIDALYLALRVALARVRGDGLSLPLIFDDPFAHLDQKRFAAALNMVNLAASEGQLILLGHNQELGKRAAKERWHVVALDEETVEAEETEGEDHAGQLHLL